MTTRLELKVPTLLQVHTPRTFAPRDPAVTSIQTLGMMAFIFYTWNQGNPADHSIASVTASPHTRGYNFDSTWLPFFNARGLTVATAVAGNGFADPGTAHVWLYSLNASKQQCAEGTPGSTRWVQLRGIAVWHFFSAMKYAISGHGWGAGHIAAVKALSRVGTRCGTGFFNFESVAQPTDYNPYLEVLRQVSRAYVLDAETTTCTETDRQPNFNGYGCTCIDKYEDQNLVAPTATVVAPGSGYVVNELITIAGGTATTRTVVKVLTLSGSGVLTASVQTNGVYTVQPSNPVAQLSTNGSGSGATFTLAGIGGHKVYTTNAVACPHSPSHAGLPGNAAGGGVHTWDCDVRSAAYIAAHVASLGNYDSLLSEAEDFKLTDNLLYDPYKGIALNNFPVAYTSAAYRGTRASNPASRSGWKGRNQSMQELYAAKPADYLWANTYNQDPAGVGAYTAQDIQNRFCESFFNVLSTFNTLDSLVNLKAKIQVAKDNGLVLCLNAQRTLPDGIWATTAGPGGAQGYWTDLLAHISAIGAWSNVVVMTGRNNNAMFWQAGFQDPNNP